MAEHPRRRSTRLEVQKQDWSTVLPLELWESIGERLPSGGDAASFRSMCRLWRAALPFTKFSPVLMLPFDRESTDGAVTFYRLTDGKAFTKNLAPALHRKVVCGSSHGWLALVDESARLTLLNPFTGATVALPRTDDGRLASVYWRHLVDGRWVHISLYDGTAREIKLGEMRDMFITEVVLSSPADSGDCTAIALLKGSCEIAYCRVGVDASWKLLHTKLRHQVSSVVQCGSKRFLAISPTGQVSICNLVGATPTARLVQCLDMPRDVSPRPRAYLQVNGELHLVCTVHGFTNTRQIYKCNVFSRTPVWSRVEKAGDLTLLTSHNFMTGHAGGSVSGLNKNYGNSPVCQQLPTSEHLWLVISNIANANGMIEMLPYHQNTNDTSEALCWIIPKPWTQGPLLRCRDEMSAKAGKALVQSVAGSYVAWSGADQPELAVEGIGCGLLLLRPLGLAMPHYADSSKFGYVLRGSGIAGVLPVAGGAATERVVRLGPGDVIVVRAGDVSWWYNDDDAGSDLSIVFMGDTARAVSPGDISYFFLAGGNSVLRGLDAAAWAPGVTAEQAAAAFRSQPAVLLTRLTQRLHGVCPREHDRKGLVTNAGHVDTGTVKMLTAADLGGDLGISAALGRLEPGAARAPWVVREGVAQAVYVSRGSARVQVSSAVGGDTLLLDEQVAAGSVFVVPRFAVAFVASGADGVEWVSLIKSARPVVENLIGEGSVLDGVAAEVVQASLNVAPEMVELLGGSRAASSN